jgi:nucleotide-binding universal stress UspA family protein
MKSILVPTDFSENAENAITYAAEMNLKINGKIILFHSYLVPVPVSDVAFSMAMIDEKEVKEAAKSTLNKLKITYEILYPGMIFETDLSEGIADSEIVTEEKLSKCDLVVMGTRGKSGMREFFIGSNTVSVINKSICPVISVPDNAKMRGLKKIVFATNFAPGDFKNAFEVVDMAREFNSHIEFLHISNGDISQTIVRNNLQEFRQRIINESKYPEISIKLLQDQNSFHGLNTYLEDYNPDLLAISTRDRSFVEKYFDRSLTKKMVHHSHIPLLALHTSV